jgi:hypothetical protein
MTIILQQEGAASKVGQKQLIGYNTTKMAT